MPDISGTVRVNAGHFVTVFLNLLVWNVTAEDFCCSGISCCVSAAPFLWVGNGGNVWRVAVAGLRGAAGSCLEILKVKICVLDAFLQSCAVSLGCVGEKHFQYTQGSRENCQQGAGVGRSLVLAVLPISPCWSRLSVCPACCWPLPRGMFCPCSAISLHPSLLPSTSIRAMWMGLVEKGIHQCSGTGVVQVFWCLGGVGTQEKCWWNILILSPGLPALCCLCNTWTMVTRSLVGTGFLCHNWINVNISNNVCMSINTYLFSSFSVWTTNCKGSNVTPFKQRRQASEIS